MVAYFGRLLTVTVLCNRAHPGLVLNTPLLFAVEEDVSMNTTVGHTKMNKAATKQAVTEYAVTQYGGNQGRRISILTTFGPLIATLWFL